MLTAQQTQENLAAQQGRFLKRIVESKQVFAVWGEDGLARVASRRMRNREVTLLWSNRAEAERWAPVLAQNPRIRELTLGAVMTDVLPGLANVKRLVGVDWSADGGEPEVDPTDLAERVRLESLDAFVHHTMSFDAVWILEDLMGPALLVSKTRPDLYFLPCWADRGEAEGRILGPWRDMMSVRIPLTDFLERKLVWLTERGHMVAPGHTEGAGSLEMAPEDLKSLYAQRQPAA